MKTLVVIALAIMLTGCSPASAPETAAPAPATTPATPPANEDAAVTVLKEIAQAQKDYFQRNRRYALDYDELIMARFLKAEPSKDTGYDFQMRPSADAATFVVSAVPTMPSSPARHFFMDQTGDVRAEAGKDATSTSPKF
jgi:hypothetical protein